MPILQKARYDAFDRRKQSDHGRHLEDMGILARGNSYV